MIFANARLIFPDGIRDKLDIIESGGKICDVRAAGQYPEPDAFDLQGNYLAPGFVDWHVHGAVGRDTMEASAEAFSAICKYHASGGTSSLLLTAATADLADTLRVIASVRENSGQFPQIAGVHVEGPFISRAHAGAQNEQFIRDPDPETVDRLLSFADIIKRVTIAPELPGSIEAISKFRERNIAVSGGHSDAWDEDARRGFEAGMRSVTHTFNCMSSARRRGPERVAGLLEFALSEPETICELIADRHHVSTTLMKMLYRAKGAAGICLSTDATAGAGMAEGSLFNLAGHPCVVANGACWLADRSKLAGSASRMIDLVQTMVRKVGVPLHEAIAMATANPARAIQNAEKGTLEVGTDADFVVLSPELGVVRTFVRGECVYAAA